MTFNIDTSALDIKFGDVKSTTQEVDFETDEIIKETLVTSDYEQLENLPTLNGNTIIGDMNESDPTVPEWAKTENKPVYTAEEIGAVNADDEMSLTDIKQLWDSIFK